MPRDNFFTMFRPNLACRCAQTDHTLRPTLAELFTTVQNAVQTKTSPSNFPGKPNAEWESDIKIAQYVKEMMLSA